MYFVKLVDIRITRGGAVGSRGFVHSGIVQSLYAASIGGSQNRLRSKRSPAELWGLAPPLMLGGFSLLFAGKVALDAGGVFDGASNRLGRLRDDDPHLHGLVLGLGELRVVRHAVKRVGAEARQLLGRGRGARGAAADSRRLAR